MAGIALNISLLSRVDAPADAPSIDDSYSVAGSFGGRIEEVRVEEVVGEHASSQPKLEIRFTRTAITDALEPGVQRLRFRGGDWEIQRVDLESRPARVWVERVADVS